MKVIGIEHIGIAVEDLEKKIIKELEENPVLELVDINPKSDLENENKETDDKDWEEMDLAGTAPLIRKDKFDDPVERTFNGLEVNWGKKNFINPPYSNVKGFLIKAHKELENGNAELCVFLTFANTDTKWFHDYCYNQAEIRFIKRRVRFVDGGKPKDAPFPSAIVIFDNTKEIKQKYKQKTLL